MDQLLCNALLSKILEQIERTDHLISALPAEQLDWSPPVPGAWPPGVLFGHLLECLAGFCAALYAAHPDHLPHFDQLRELPVNCRCSRDAARERIGQYRACIAEGFALLTDADLGRLVPTAFVSSGESILTLLLGNMEHLINHKHQLFMYLRLMGLDVRSQDLYHFRGP